MVRNIENRAGGDRAEGDGNNVVIPQQAYHDHCPYLAIPFEDCYCASGRSTFVESTILYCGGDFRRCEIYCRYAFKE